MVKQETRDKVESIMKKTGYSPDPQARALALRKSFLITLAYDNPSPQYVVNIQRGILDALEDTDYQLILRPIDRSSPDFVEKFQAFAERHRPSGVIMPPSISEIDSLANILDEEKCHYIRIASVKLGREENSIQTHDFEGAAQAARHLAALGHKKIAHIHGPETFRSSHERLAGFKQGLSEFDLALSPELTIEAGYTYETGLRAADKLLLRKNPPTAIFTGNDEMALGTYKSARRLGLSIPEELSVASFDDTPMASRITPPLTSVKLPIREIGYEAAMRLLSILNNTPPKMVRSFLPEINIRESTRRISS